MTRAVRLDAAEALGVERLVNSYLRETGRHDPPTTRGPATVVVPLPATGRCLTGRLSHRSLTGHHRYGCVWWLVGDGGRRPVTDAGQAASAILTELGTGRRTACPIRALVGRVRDSTRRIRRFLEAHPEAPGGLLDDPDPMMAGEQAVLTGHVFHPTPKVAEGFHDRDTDAFAPELGGRFALDWVALPTDLVDEHRGPGGAGASADLDRPVAASGPAGWTCLPVHPWQARTLRRRRDVAELVAAGKLVDLGPHGPPVVATASVRTVLVPWAPLFVKLPLAVRVTNFRRTNPVEQLRRSLDADAALACLGVGEDPARPVVLREPVGRWPRLALGLAEHLAVLARRAPRHGSTEPVVLAALLEEGAGHTPPAVVEAIARAANRPVPAVEAAHVDGWFDRYVEVVVRPLARLLLEAGVSLEAHVQNSLVTLEGGWPRRLVVRDLEGTSLDPTHPRLRELVDDVLPADSPALYPADGCWQRFAYYVLVNHLSHLTAVLARHLPADPRRLWTQVRAGLQAEERRAARHADARRLHRLVTAATLPAKANLLSCLLGRSERPLYVPVPNPMAVVKARP